MTHTRVAALVGFLLLVGVFVRAQEAPKAATGPTLSEVQKLTIQNKAKDVELWQLRAQQAASEYDKARADLTKLLAEVTPQGFTLNDRLDLVPVPAPEKKP
jgi:hypothetical protein